MKKFIGILLLLTCFSSSYAISTDELAKNIMSKEVVVSEYKIKNDFGKGYVEAFDKYFLNIRYDNDKDALNRLESILEPIITNYSKKDNLSSSQEKAENLFKHLYYRSKLLNTYYLD